MDRAPQDDQGPDTGAILRDRRSSAPRHLLGDGWRDPVASLERVRALVADVGPDATDFYGADGVVEVLEDEVCDLLGLEAAVFMPSGTMAQQAALRCHVDAAGVTTVGWHPRAHPDLWEDQAMARLHGLTARCIGDLDTLLTLGDLEEVDEPLAAILWELPQRELGGMLPAFDDLVDQVAWARDRGIATHLDGARLWTVAEHWGRDLADVAGLFDSVYVSFYKDLGGWAGAVLGGSADLVAEARLWRHRHGGTLYALWPYAACALDGLRHHLPRMPEYVAHARALAAAVVDLDGVEVVPDPPQTTMFHLWLRADADALAQRMLDHLDRTGLFTWVGASPTPLPSWSSLEVQAGAATMDVDPDEFRALVRELVTGSADVA